MRMLVTTNVPLLTMSIIDTHSSRSTATIVGMLGEPNARNMSAVANVFLDPIASKGRSPAQIIQVIDNHRDALRLGACVHHAGRGLGLAAIGGAIARAYYHEDRQRIEQFADVYISGLPHDNADSAVIRLRAALLKMPSHGGSTNRARQYLMAESAIVSFCQRKSVQRISAFDRVHYSLPLGI